MGSAKEETTFRIEPTHLEHPSELVADFVAEVVKASAELGARLHPRTASSLADLVRVMNCYYSNLIEGHNTRPRDIERALAEDLDDEQGRRNLQLEARAHIRVHANIDSRFAENALPEPSSVEFVKWLHREFYRDAPDEMLEIGDGERTRRMTPGSFRSRPEEDNVVGRHHPPTSDRVDMFMGYFEDRFRLEPMGTSKKIISIAIAHHRFNYIHPFLDGNGRVSRLMSHATALHAGIGAHGLWSISRGLARGLTDPSEYKTKMDDADTPRTSDHDGRGNLSRDALQRFVAWFLEVALDQLRFMTSLFDLDSLTDRLTHYVSSRPALRPEAAAVLHEVLMRGEMPRGDAPRATGLKERTARTVLASLIEDGILASQTSKSPVHLRFTSDSADSLFPRLFLPD